MAADRLIDGDVLLADLGGAAISCGEALLARAVAHRGHHLVERPFEVDGGRTGGGEHCTGALERFVGGIRTQGQRHPIGRRRSDQRRSAHPHVADRRRRLGKKNQQAQWLFLKSLYPSSVRDILA